MTFALGTGDPRFDPAKPLTVNGYRFVPAAAQADVVEIAFAALGWVDDRMRDAAREVASGRSYSEELFLTPAQYQVFRTTLHAVHTTLAALRDSGEES